MGTGSVAAGEPFFRTNTAYCVIQGQSSGTLGLAGTVVMTDAAASDWGIVFVTPHAGACSIGFGESVTGWTIGQAVKSGTGANVGVTGIIQAQPGQAQTGAAANNNGGILSLGGGVAGTGGSGAAATSGAVQIVGGQRVTTRTIASTGTVRQHRDERLSDLLQLQRGR